MLRVILAFGKFQGVMPNPDRLLQRHDAAVGRRRITDLDPPRLLGEPLHEGAVGAPRVPASGLPCSAVRICARVLGMGLDQREPGLEQRGALAVGPRRQGPKAAAAASIAAPGLGGRDVGHVAERRPVAVGDRDPRPACGLDPGAADQLQLAEEIRVFSGSTASPCVSYCLSSKRRQHGFGDRVGPVLARRHADAAPSGSPRAPP